MQLVMFLTGFTGAGRSTCVIIAQRFCFEFCRATSIPWDDATFPFTQITGPAVSLFGGRTIHDAAFLCGNVKNISNTQKDEWEHVRMLIIDEISFFTMANLKNLDKHLKNILSRQDLPYDGMLVFFLVTFINSGQLVVKIMAFCMKEL